MSQNVVNEPQASAFQFDVNFAAPKKEPEIPTIALPDHETALKQAEQQGYQRGIKEGRAGEETRLANEAKRIADMAAKILAAIDQDRQRLEKQSASLALSIAKKLADGAVAAYPLADIEKIISDCLGPLRQTPHLVVRLNEKDADTITETIGKFVRESGFEGRFVVLGEPDFRPGDCRIEWADGGIVRSRAKAETEIEQAFAAFFAHVPDDENAENTEDKPQGAAE